MRSRDPSIPLLRPVKLNKRVISITMGDELFVVHQFKVLRKLFRPHFTKRKYIHSAILF